MDRHGRNSRGLVSDTAEKPPLTPYRLRVLIVEDQPHMRELVRQALARHGIRHVYEAEEGGAGLRMTVRVRPELVLCDLHMEPVHGLDYLESLRDFDNPAIAPTPVGFPTLDAAEETGMPTKSPARAGHHVNPHR